MGNLTEENSETPTSSIPPHRAFIPSCTTPGQSRGLGFNSGNLTRFRAFFWPGLNLLNLPSSQKKMKFLASFRRWVTQKLSSFMVNADEQRRTIRYYEEQISEGQATYDKKSTVRNILLTSYVAGQGAIIAGVLSGQRMKKLIGCASAWSILILSGIVSVSVIVALVFVFFQQFKLFKRGKQLQEGLDSVIDSIHPNQTLEKKRIFYSTYKREVFETASSIWWAQRVAILAVLIASSVCLLVICARLLC